ncbi:MAG TPA: thioredoxin domain-containing protein [Acidobacteriaceae bacterium]|nr:thioredoxin domain-containing protein [Acidobacteriaceae bacterium]
MKPIRKRISHLLPLFALLTASVMLQAQVAPSTHVTDPGALKPPPGARVAIYEFEDMECPDCARANPILKEAAEKYHIPWIRHDFPLPFHAWSFQAAVDARWFDTKSKKIGDEFRDAVFADQPNIQTTEQLRAYAENFATQHKIVFPFVVDPQGKLAAEVKADYALGQRIGIEHTPTIWIVTNKTSGVPFVEVLDRSRLYEIIDQALAETASETEHTRGTHHVERAG